MYVIEVYKKGKYKGLWRGLAGGAIREYVTFEDAVAAKNQFQPLLRKGYFLYVVEVKEMNL